MIKSGSQGSIGAAGFSCRRSTLLALKTLFYFNELNERVNEKIRYVQRFPLRIALLKAEGTQHGPSVIFGNVPVTGSAASDNRIGHGQRRDTTPAAV